MSNHYLVVDDARRVYFDCDKFLPAGAGPDDGSDVLHEQPFEVWLRAANWGDDPPEETNRYVLALPEGRSLYDFLVAANWKVRIVSLDSDDWEAIYEPWARREGRSSYRCVGTLDKSEVSDG